MERYVPRWQQTVRVQLRNSRPGDGHRAIPGFVDGLGSFAMRQLSAASRRKPRRLRTSGLLRRLRDDLRVAPAYRTKKAISIEWDHLQCDVPSRPLLADSLHFAHPKARKKDVDWRE
jgi:hypothetical protein